VDFYWLSFKLQNLQALVRLEALLDNLNAGLEKKESHQKLRVKVEVIVMMKELNI
jgi:hypothetical protein